MKDYEPHQAGRVLADLSARHPNATRCRCTFPGA